MFNKKKKNWQHNNKPNYKKGHPGENQNPAGDDRVSSNPRPTVQAVNTELLEPVELPPELTLDPSPARTAQQQSDIVPPPAAEGEVQTLVNTPNCQICNMPIRSHFTAVRHKDTDELVHFDCALRELSKENMPKLNRFRKIYYIGAGNFAIVKEIYDKRGRFKSYEIVERIVYEKREK